MSDLIQACTVELNDNLPYLRHPGEAMSAVARDIRRGFRIGADFGLLDVAELISGSLLFAFVVVPLGIIGKLSG